MRTDRARGRICIQRRGAAEIAHKHMPALHRMRIEENRGYRQSVRSRFRIGQMVLLAVLAAALVAALLSAPWDVEAQSYDGTRDLGRPERGGQQPPLRHLVRRHDHVGRRLG